jgi:hypothetical protein
MLNAIVISPYFLLRFLIKDQSGIHRAFHVLLWVGLIESAYGILCFLSNHIFQTTFGVEVGQYGAIPGIYGTQYEANLFGSYSACCAIMFLACFLLSHESRRSWYGWGFAVTAVAAVISLARSVFLAFPVAALLVIWITLKKGGFQVRRLVPLLLGVSLLLVAFSPVVLSLVRERFSTIDLADISADDTTWARLIQMAVAVKDIQARPMLGTGTASFHLFFDPADYPVGFSEDADEPGWIGNTPLRSAGFPIVCRVFRGRSPQGGQECYRNEYSNLDGPFRGRRALCHYLSSHRSNYIGLHLGPSRPFGNRSYDSPRRASQPGGRRTR